MKVLEELKDMFEQQLERKGIGMNWFSFGFSPKDSFAFDGIRYKQILANVLQNSVKFS